MSYLFKSRPQVVERESYETMAPQEKFIVSVLRHHIEHVLSNYAEPVSKNSRVLDVGCGRQPFRKSLEELGYHYYSIDVQQSPNESVDVICEIDKQLPIEVLNLAPFDFIFCTEVMEHVADWETTFRNFSHLLSSKGRLFITCPHFYQLHEIPYDFWRPTPYAFQYFADKFGLKILHQASGGDAWDVLGTVLANFYSVPASQSLRDRLLNKIVTQSRQLLLQLLIDRRLQSSVHLKSPLYISNIVVFEKWQESQ